MVRHDYIGDIRTEYAKDANDAVPFQTNGIVAGDHETLILVATYYAATGDKETTIKIQESDDKLSWSDVAGSSVVIATSGLAAGRRTWIVERRKHGRYLRADFSTTKSAHSLTGVWLKMGDKVRSTETQADTTIV